jgi:16S rRNA (guanine966-N2)-methyltransferase
LDTLMDIEGSRVLDLFAGSGAVGLEALSRGAAYALLVESEPRAVKAIRANISLLKASSAHVSSGKVSVILGAGNPQTPYDLVFADPPYPLSEEELTAVLTALVTGKWLAEDAVVVLERSSRSPEPSWVEGVTLERGRRYGESALWYGRATETSGLKGETQ